MQQASEVARILFPERFIEVVFGFKTLFDFRRGWFAFAIERSAWRNPHQHECQKADKQKKRNQQQDAPHEIHINRAPRREPWHPISREDGVRRAPLEQERIVRRSALLVAWRGEFRSIPTQPQLLAARLFLHASPPLPPD